MYNSKHRNKKTSKKCYDFILKKRHIKGEKHKAEMDFAKYLRKSDVSENSNIYYGRFLRNGLHKRYFYISKGPLANHFSSRRGNE